MLPLSLLTTASLKRGFSSPRPPCLALLKLYPVPIVLLPCLARGEASDPSKLASRTHRPASCVLPKQEERPLKIAVELSVGGLGKDKARPQTCVSMVLRMAG